MAPSAVYIEEATNLSLAALPVVGNPSDLKEIPVSVAFGGDDQWHYIAETKRFDLSRGSRTKLVIDADDGIRNHRGCMIDPEKTVLLVIDMQNYFIHPACRDHKEGITAVQPTLRVIERCRDEDIQVIWLNWGINEDDLRVMPPAVQRGFCRNRAEMTGIGWHVGLGAELPDNQGRCLWKGSWNAQIYDPLLDVATKEDLYFDKNRPSGLWNPNGDLSRYLQESGKKTIMFAGVNTDQCVLGTLVDGYSWGYDCIMLGDCCGTMTTGFGAKELCDYNVATNYGFVATSDDFVNAPKIEDSPVPFL